tara:strand:+ start:1844 stop:2029 length:186 start_codon:yes stop_codon:yes gene_type:complete
MTVIVRKVSERLEKARENAKLHREHLIRKIREEEKEKCVKVLRKTEFGDIYSKIRLPQPKE